MEQEVPSQVVIPTGLRHIAITMDGNGRWAQAKSRPRTFGHRAGAKVAFEMIDEVNRLGLEYLTLYAFSYENWERDPHEVHYLLEELLPKTIRRYKKRAKESQIKICIVGDLSRLSAASRKEIEGAVEETADNTGTCVTFAISYSGRLDLVEAAKKIADLAGKGELNADQIDETLFANMLQSSRLPDIDLHIRCGKVNRLSNLLPWQMGYAEQLPLDLLWPDFNAEHMHRAIQHFSGQERRFGRVLAQDA